MRASEAFAQMANLPVRGFRDGFPSTAPILILAPHPDDESLGCGGLIAAACEHGNPPIVAILTDGAFSHPQSRRYPAPRLRALREAETRAAMGQLGLPPARLFFLAHPDGAAPRTGEPLLAAAAALARLVRRHGCQTLAVTWRHDPHGDHEAAAAIAAHAARQTGARRLAYPIWGLTLPPETELDEPPIRGFRLDIETHLPAKRAAIAEHRSQYAGIIDDDPDGFQMSESFIARFTQPTEIYLELDQAA